MAGGAIRSLLIVELPDEIDGADCDAIAFGLLAAVAAPGLVIADMTGTAFCDSAAMRMLLAVHDRAQAAGYVRRARIPGVLGAASSSLSWFGFRVRG